MANKPGILNLLLLTGIGLCLLQVWLPGHYLTCDGPCHLYNARIMHDLWQGSNTALYQRFYDLVYTADPNSMSTFVLASLLYVAKGAVAEKIFLSLYVLVYVTGFCALLRKISNGNSYWQLSVFIFVFTYALSKGFYNFSFGIAFYFWMVWAWLHYMDKRSAIKAVLFFVCCTLTFFTHLLPFVLGVITCASLLLSFTASGNSTKGKSSTQVFLARNGFTFALLIAPFIVLAVLFTGREGGLRLHLSPHPYRLVELIEFKYIINIVNTERLWAAIAGIILSLLSVIALVNGLRKLAIHKYDGFLLALLVAVFVYTFFPEDFMGRAIIISIRVQLFVFIIVVCCIAYRLPPGRITNAAAVALFVCFLVLSGYRIGCRQVADAALNDYLSAASHIPNGSSVLPFDFSPTGKDKEGNLIADRNAIFHHAAQYLAADRPLIVLDNYEANMGYFPVRWKPEVNPYNHLSKEEGIEGLPPFARIAAFHQQTGVAIDYVLFWCYDPAYLANAHFKELYAEINSLYQVAYTSPGSRTVLYARKSLPAK